MATSRALPIRLHIQEIRNRLIWVVLVFLAGGFVGYAYHNQIIIFLRHYMPGSLYYTNPAGGFNFIMKVSVLTGAIAAIPLCVYQIIKFVEPALKKEHAYKRVWVVTLLSFGLALLGMAFAALIVVPISLRFFAGFSVSGLQPLISADEYLNFIMKAIGWFAVLFQIPLLMLFINRITPLPPRRLLKYEKHVVVIGLIIALVLPFTYDPITQLVIAIPIVLLYNLSILFIWRANRSAAKRRKRGSKSVIDIKPTKPVKTPVVAKPAKQAVKQIPTYSRSQPRVIHDIQRPGASILPRPHAIAARRPSQAPLTSTPRKLTMDMISPQQPTE
ncbi:MAG: twin-arginine translocase subunit TatC [Candidatus Saccharimonadales bacterium]